MPRDPWLDELANVGPEEFLDDEVRISAKWLFGEFGLNIAPGQRQDYHAERLARVMRQLGWEGPAPMRIKGRNE